MNKIGIDIGSRLTKFVTFSNNNSPFFFQNLTSTYEIAPQKIDKSHKFIHTGLINTVDFYSEIEVFRKELENFEIKCTGYGKNNINFSENHNNFVKIPELKSHHRGAIVQSGLENFILLDIGGQDTKVILSKNGKMVDFITNEKCAASSGRFLENMSNILGINEIGNYYQNVIELNSTCAIFTESELIGLLSSGIKKDVLAASVNYALYKRFKKLIMKFSSEIPIVFAGGLAENKALNYFIKKDFGKAPVKMEFPVFNGAIGAFFS